jgi:CBS domain-containing protein
MKVSEILKNKGPQVVTIWEEKTIQESIDLMVQNKIGGLMVINAEGKLTGIVTERDILRAYHAHPDAAGELAVKEIMTRKVIIGNKDDTLEYVESVMTENRVRHLPIISEKRLIGIISIGDVVKALSKESKSENRYLKDFIEGKYPG